MPQNMNIDANSFRVSISLFIVLRLFCTSDVWEWFLVIQRSAVESDLEESCYLEGVGDLIWQTVLGISHCPYCGAALESAKCKNVSRNAEIHHIDSSGCSSIIL